MTDWERRNPLRFERRTLLCVAGLFPQVVTETLYALAIAARDPFVPTEVFLVSTEEGVKRARLMLLSPDQAWFQRLCDDYQLDGVHFDSGSLITLQGPDGPLTDIRTETDNAAAADQITQLIADLTQDPTRALHVSIAGGRKTLGFYAGYALSLLGRPQDRLSHVLVNEPFEANANFFYPPPQSRVLILEKTRPVETSEARVELALIPFVRLRHGLPTGLVTGKVRFGEVVKLAEQEFGLPTLDIDIGQGRLLCAGRLIPMRPMSLAIYIVLAERARAQLHPMSAVDLDESEFLDHVTEVYRRLRKLDPWSPPLEQLRRRLQSRDRTQWFREHASRANEALLSALANSSEPYRIRMTGQRKGRRYGLDLPPERIDFAAET